MRTRLMPVLVAGLLLAACGDDTSSGGGGNGGEPEGGNNVGGEGGRNTGGDNVGGDGGDGGQGGSDPVCGDGSVEAPEACDDGNTAGGDGCSASCTVEAGFDCTGQPSTCTTVCGDGVIAGTEACDDGNTDDDDGCSSTCTVASGWECTGEPSTCSSDCGDGVIAVGAEACDDGNTDSDDGCDATCAVEPGWSCDMEPSECTTGCGDGIIAGMEECDDANMADDDGCSAACDVEAGYACFGEPSNCVVAGADCTAPIVASDGFSFVGSDIAQYGDDLDFGSLTGCFDVAGTQNTSPEIVFSIDLMAGQRLNVRNFGTEDLVWQVVDACAEQACLTSFDGNPGLTEQTQGLNFLAPATSTYYVVVESYFGAASLDPADTFDLRFEVATCGDGLAEFGEACDDGNTSDGDGCSASCSPEPGFVCLGSPSSCVRATCADPVVVSTFPFQLTGSNPANLLDDATFNGAGCSAVSSTPPSGYDIVFRVDLVTGQQVRLRQVNSAFDGILRILTPGTCAPGAACVANTDFGEATGITHTATTDGPVFLVVETWGNETDPYDIRIDASTCGNGVVELAEGCDDGGVANGDGCSATCGVELGYECTGAPSVCTPVPPADCTDPIVVTGSDYQLTGTAIAGYGDTANFNPGIGCSDVGSGAGNDIVFRMDLIAGETVRVRELSSTFDAQIHILEAGQCAAGVTCAGSTGADTEGVTYTAVVNESVYIVVESATSTSNNAPFDIRIQKSTCGDGVTSLLETCDDGNATGGDGCSAICQIEATAALGACAGTVVTATATGLGVAVPDNNATGVNVVIPIAASGTIQSMAVAFSGTHTWAGDFQIRLDGPAGGNHDVSTGNGSSGDNYFGTRFVNTAATAITSGSPPFSGTFRPEALFTPFFGQSVTGNWTLRVADSAIGDVGRVVGYDVAFCVTP